MSRAYALLARVPARASVIAVVSLLIGADDVRARVDNPIAVLTERAHGIRELMLQGVSVQAVAQDLLRGRLRAVRDNEPANLAVQDFIKAVLGLDGEREYTYDELLTRFYTRVIASTDAIYEIFMPIYAAARVLYPTARSVLPTERPDGADAPTPDERLAAAVAALERTSLPVQSGGAEPPDPVAPVPPAGGPATPARGAPAAAVAPPAAAPVPGGGAGEVYVVPQPRLDLDAERERIRFSADVAPELQDGHYAFRSLRRTAMSFGQLLDPPELGAWRGGEEIQDGRAAYIVNGAQETLLLYVSGSIQPAFVMLFNTGYRDAIWANLTSPHAENHSRFLVSLLLRALDVLKLNQAVRVGGKRGIATEQEITRVNLRARAAGTAFVSIYGGVS